MRIAICFSGQLRGDYENTIKQITSAIPSADVYFTTWKGQTQKHYMDTLKINVDWMHKYYDEPVLHYNPATENANEFPAVYHKWLKNRQAYLEEWKHRTKQILAHALVVKDFANDYDVIIRARYDSVISNKMKSEMYNFCEKAYYEKKAFGFFIPRQNGDPTHELEKDTPIEIPKDTDRHKMHLVDHMIIHRRDMFDCDKVWKMHYDKTLLVAEYGWWQILSEPYGNNHTCIRGYVGLKITFRDQQKKNNKKVAIIVSGQVRSDTYYGHPFSLCSIPNSKIFFTTWKNPEDSQIASNTKLNYIDKYYDMREYYDHENEGEIEQWQRRGSLQHLAHALAIKDLIDESYDIVIRVRYDIFMIKMFSSLVWTKIIDLVYDNKKPFGIGPAGSLIHGVKGVLSIEDMHIHEYTLGDRYWVPDHLIIHRRDMFDADQVISDFNRHLIKSSEHGWWQYLCKPYNVEPYFSESWPFFGLGITIDIVQHYSKNDKRHKRILRPYYKIEEVEENDE